MNDSSNIDFFTKYKEYTNKSQFKDLYNFLNLYKISKSEDDYSFKSNIYDSYKKQAYAIPDNRIHDFMNLLNECHKNKIYLNFLEKQNNDGSGIMYDFDIVQNDNKFNVIDNIQMNKLLTRILSIIKDNVNLNLILKSDFNNLIDDDEINNVHNNTGTVQYVSVIRKPNLLYSEQKKAYKNGFHILIPGIKIKKNIKKFLFEKIKNDEFINKLFSIPKVGLNLEDVFDMGSVSVPVYFIGNSKFGIQPYEIYNIYKFDLFNDDVNLSEIITNVNYKKYNLIHEFSLNYSCKLIKKINYEHFESINDELLSTNDEMDDEMVENNKDISILNLVEPDTEYIKSLLETISLDRVSDRNKWRDLIFCISNINPRFKPLAIYISKKNKEKWNMVEFNKIWNDALASNLNRTTKLNLNSLIYWAKLDNETLYEKKMIKSIKDVIRTDLFENKLIKGDLSEWHFASYLSLIFKDKFVTDIDIASNKFKWYEFIIEQEEHLAGELFKWRTTTNLTKTLNIYISTKLINICTIIYDEINNNITELTNENEDGNNQNLIDYLKEINKKFANASKKLYNSNFKKSILDTLAIKLQVIGFTNSLNKDENIIGVKNGVLELSDNIKLINYYHNYHISFSSTIAYKKFDKNNLHIKRLLKVLRELFPPNEQDAFEFMMYYFASCLDGRVKDSILMILNGSGCHAFNTEIMLYDKTIKKVQDVKVGDYLIGDDGNSRKVIRLFHGKENMIEVKPENETSFEVNINHILSLKFTELSKIVHLDNNKLLFIWYSYNNLLSPVKNKKLFYSIDDLNLFKSKLKNIVNENDIIDIKITNLLLWDSSWYENGFVKLYKYDQINKTNKLYSFKLKLKKEDFYYGFEITGNHRYLTKDNFVHHNSNGKSFLVEMITSTLGRYYADKVPLSFLTSKRTDSKSADPALMRLEGLRLAYYSEIEKNEELMTSKIKELTGQEQISGRNLYEAQKTFKPVCHHVITTNYHFSIKTTDHGIWRRILTYELKYKFVNNPDPDNENEKKLDTKIAKDFKDDDNLKEAMFSILTHYYEKFIHIYDGCLFNIPKATIDNETENYRNNEDFINKFIVERAVKSENITEKLNDIVSIFRKYYENIDKRYINSITNIEITQQFLNSSLKNKFYKDSNVIKIDNIRFLEDGEELNESEEFLNKHI